jgi:hypothetical protein
MIPVPDMYKIYSIREQAVLLLQLQEPGITNYRRCLPGMVCVEVGESSTPPPPPITWRLKGVLTMPKLPLLHVLVQY